MMNNIEKKTDNEEIDLELINSVKINDNVDLNFYKNNEKTLIGISHFKFEEEILLKKETMDKIIEMIQLVDQKEKLNEKMNKLGLK